MRELVYLSNRKLATFDLGRRRGLLDKFKATVKAPLGLGEFMVEADGSRRTVPDLDRVLTELDRSERAPVWFTDDVMPGQWVQFEAPLSHAVVGTTAVFLDVEEPMPGYPMGGQRRLMVHGAAEHLVCAGLRPRTSVEELSAEAADYSPVPAEAFESVFNHFFELIEYVTGHDVTSRNDPGMVMVRNKITASGLEHVIPTMGRHLRLPGSAAWMAGCARVTQVVPAVRGLPVGTLFASPLYVEYVAAPREEG